MAAGKVNTEGLLSFKLKDFSEGGLLPDGRYILRNNKVVTWDYDGKAGADTKTTALRFEAFPITVDSKGKITVAGEPRIQYYSAGDPDKILPSDNGLGFKAVTSNALSKQSNFFLFYESLCNSGFDEDKFDCTNVGVWDEMAVDIYNKVQPKREGLKSNLVQAGPTQPERDRTIPLVKVIGKMPNEKVWNLSATPASGAVAGRVETPAASPAASGQVTGKAPEPPDEGNGSPEESLTRILTLVLNGATSKTRTETRVETFKKCGSEGMDADAKKAVMDLFQNEDVLGAALMGVGNGYSIDGPNIVAVP